MGSCILGVVLLLSRNLRSSDGTELAMQRLKCPFGFPQSVQCRGKMFIGVDPALTREMGFVWAASQVYRSPIGYAYIRCRGREGRNQAILPVPASPSSGPLPFGKS